MNRPAKGYVDGGPTFNYTKPPTGGKMLVLTVGGVADVMDWQGEPGQYFLGWLPLPSRDREKEAEVLAAWKNRSKRNV